MHSLWLRCPHGRSGQWKNAQGSPVAERVLSAELRGEINPSEYRCADKLCGAGFSSAPLSFYFWIIFREKKQTKNKKQKNLEVDFLDRGGEKKKISCLTVYNCLPPSAARQRRQRKSIYFYPPYKKKKKEKKKKRKKRKEKRKNSLMPLI